MPSALIGQGEAANVARHVEMGEQGAGKRLRCIFVKASLRSSGVQRLALSLTKNALPVGFILAHSFNPALTARKSE
jgi:hypothetical protein